jgi:hypothetical protein
MGFDPRSWARAPARGRQVTCNVDALLAENELLRQEVVVLRQQLSRLQAKGTGHGVPAGFGRGRSSVTTGAAPGISEQQVRRWSEVLCRHPRWSELRVGASIRSAGSVSCTGLKGLIEELRRHWADPRSDLEEELDRRVPGLGSELRQALKGPQTKARLAVKAAFALHGGTAPQWLSLDPMRLVDELLARIERLEASTRQAQQQQQRRQWQQQQQREGEQERERDGAAGVDHRRAAALEVLGLGRDASREAVKLAHRRLVKRHHPDMGGDAESFRRINAAYQLLCA